MTHLSSSTVEVSSETCLAKLIADQASRAPEAVAIAALERPPLTYGRLYSQIEHVVAQLNEMGIGQSDRLAIVLPDGPEMAVAFLAVAAGATAAPLNPAYRANEFTFYLSDLRAKALIVQSGLDSPARAVAQTLRIPVIELCPVPEQEAGVFTLSGERTGRPVTSGLAQPDDVALVLHTSGTTARPKLVPLTQRNLCASAHNIRASLNLVERDRCLNVMPLFHIHGLIGAVLSSLTAGASVVCTPGFFAPKFLTWMEEFGPTWYSAVPTMHQAILARAAAHGDGIARAPLRFIRSSSAPLPSQVTAQLESVFNVPVIDSYGMTEACHQIASNPLPPRARKAGSVGLAAGLEVAIIDEAGRLLPSGETGEVMIRGTNVTSGYENGAAANQSAFANGWFRTGDQGFLDSDGYLFLTGRLKEIINRGGEKISPREVDEVLMDHPAVAQAVTFSVPDDKLGEEAAAAVVLREGTSATDMEIRDFAAKRLTDFKVPSQILILSEIPKGPTGKVQRVGLAEKLGVKSSFQVKIATKTQYTAPRTPLEEKLVQIWAEVLGLERVGIHDNFFDMGGDSILATLILSRVREALRAELSFLSFFEAPTVAGMAASIEKIGQEGQDLQTPPIRPITRDGELPLSFAQQRLWFFDQLEPGSPAYNRPAFMRLTGCLNIAVLERCLSEIVGRHEVLRTAFPSVDGRPFQMISQAVNLTLPVVDLGDWAKTEREAEARRLAWKEAQRPFDLASGPLLRAALLRLSEEEHILLLTTHHIAFDGWSDGVLYEELAALYEAFASGQRSPLSELPIQYADFAVWQRRWLEGEVLEKQLSYWRRQLRDLPVLELSTDRPRPAVQTFRGASQSRALPKALSEDLKELGRQEGSTLFMTLLATFQVLLYRHTGQEDIAVGTDVANRNRVETEGLIGFFVNLLVMRTNLSGNPTFRELLRRVREMALGAYMHQDVPFERLVEELRPQRDLSRNPLVQVLFVMQNAPMRALKLSGLRLSPFEVGGNISRFDLGLSVTEQGQGQGLVMTWNYSTDLFGAAAIDRMMGHFETLLGTIVTQPDNRLKALPMVSEAERSQQAMEKRTRHASNLRSFKKVIPKAVDLSQVSLVKTDYLRPGEALPLMVQPGLDDVDLVEWAKANTEFIERQLSKHGAILFRGFSVSAVSQFEKFALAICPELFGEYGDLPREGAGGKVYESTPYPPDQAILFHNESSHMHRWPMKQWFFCVQAARQMGETPIVDCRKVYQFIDAKILEPFVQKGIVYVRNFTDKLDVSWQDFFKTTDRSVVENFCRNASIDFEWRENSNLRIRQLCPAVARHPKTREMVWFNQLQHWHLSCLDRATRESLLSLFREQDLPRNCYYGDGSAIEDSVMEEISEVYRKTAVSFPWQQGDILMVDNMLVAHGRNPYVGPRKIVVAMGEMISKEELQLLSPA